MDRWYAQLTRRRFFQVAALAGGSAALAACGADRGASPVAPATPAATGRASPLPSPLPSVTSPNPTPDSAATVLVRDVLDFELRGPFEWNGGSVTMRLHEGRLDDEPVYFVRTDTSDEAFAEEVGLVLVPLLRLAVEQDGAVGRLFLFATTPPTASSRSSARVPDATTSRRSTRSTG